MNVRKALDDSRVFSRAPMVESTARQYRQALAEHIEQPFRELLAYCEKRSAANRTPDYPAGDAADAYEDVAARLRSLLDGK